MHPEKAAFDLQATPGMFSVVQNVNLLYVSQVRHPEDRIQMAKPFKVLIYENMRHLDHNTLEQGC